MPDNINYTRIIWQNGAEGQTPLNAENLNKMDSAIADLESELLEIQGSGTSALQMKQDGTSGVFSFTGKNPNATEIDATLTGDITYGATGNFATVLGGKASAQGKRSMAQGTTTIAKGNYSHAEGDNSVALGGDSHAEGYATVANGTASHSEGNNTIAKGEISHAEGFSTQAIGVGAHAEGAHTKAIGDYSHASGLNTEARHNGQTVIGHCNHNKKTTVFEVGCGWTDEHGVVQQRANAFEVYLDGHAEVAAMGITANSVATKDYVDTTTTNILEVAEGKSDAYILSCFDSLSTCKEGLGAFYVYNYETKKWENKKDLLTKGYFDLYTIINDKFFSQEKYIAEAGDNYLILRSIGDHAVPIGDSYNRTRDHFLLSLAYKDASQILPKVGDIFLTTEMDVPDRWYGGGLTPAVFYTLDSRKYEVGATNLKDQPSGSVAQKDAIYDGAAIVFNDGTNGTQPGDNVPGSEVTGFQSVAFGGLQYDFVNEAENNFGYTPTSVNGNQSMAVGGSVHVNGDWSFACCKDNETYQKLAFAAGGGNRVGQTEEEFNALWNWNLNEDGQPIDADKKTYENSDSLSAVFGETNRVTRRACFAAGSSNVVSRDYSAAFGRWNEITAAGGTTQFVCGYYNFNNANDIFEIGNGTASNRRNAFYVTTAGKAYVYSQTTISDANNVLTTKGFTETRYLIKPAGTVNNDSIMYQNSSGSNQWKAISDTAFWSNNVNSPKAWSAMMRNSAGKSEVATATSADSKYTIANKEYVDTRIPEAPNADGTYVLKCTVTNGVKKYNWIKE